MADMSAPLPPGRVRPVFPKGPMRPDPDEIRAAPEPPDLSDLEQVIFNIETRSGEQYSLIVGRQGDMKLSLSHDHEGDFETILGDGEEVRTLFRGPQAWEFVIRLE